MKLGMGPDLRVQPASQLLCLIDIGGSGGLQGKWVPHADRLLPVFVEPNPQQAELIRQTSRDSIVIDVGLSHRDETRRLFITRNPYCVSVLRPNQSLLARYAIRPHFEVLEELDVVCARYDTLFAQGRVPLPDAIKIDIQGFEYEVLAGFGGLLENCLGIELETHFYQLYEGQKLLSDIVRQLQDYGFVLRRIHPVGHFEGDLVEVDAFFTKSRSFAAAMPDEQRWKFDLLRDVWNLAEY